VVIAGRLAEEKIFIDNLIAVNRPSRLIYRPGHFNCNDFDLELVLGVQDSNILCVKGFSNVIQFRFSLNPRQAKRRFRFSFVLIILMNRPCIKTFSSLTDVSERRNLYITLKLK
jgi:hypothetical protein